MDKRCALDLVLVRHAEAEDHSSDGTDTSRRLTARGQEQAATVARALGAFVLQEGLEIWFSPKLRTQQTAEALQCELHAPIFQPQPALATGDFSRLAFAWQDRIPGHLILVGHQPFLGDWCADLCGLHLPMSKASVTFLRTKDDGSRFQYLGHLRVELLQFLTRA